MPKFRILTEHIIEAESPEQAISDLVCMYAVSGEVVSVEEVLDAE